MAKSPGPRPAALPPQSEGVFLNCPFDEDYRPIFEAIVFTIIDCGFTCRCALESDNSAETRIQKITDMIGSCRLGIHDLSRVQLDAHSQLPRFNMPFELGLFIGAKKYGAARHRSKSCLILEGERFSYQKYLSDLAGHDTRAHQGDPHLAMDIVIKWLQTETQRPYCRESRWSRSAIFNSSNTLSPLASAWVGVKQT